jgi:hypothetical protein
MTTERTAQPDPAPIFACALSLWRECMKRSRGGQRVNVSECYNGGDEFMRVIMRAGTRFEEWACRHIAFDQLDDVWPYLLEERFGEACAGSVGIESLDTFNGKECLAVALRLRLPVKADGSLPVPVDVSAANPSAGSEFVRFRIQTVRARGETDMVPFTLDDDPFDQAYEAPVFAVYGVGDDGLLEHIADRATYAEAVSFVCKLVPGIRFPETAHAR